MLSRPPSDVLPAPVPAEPDAHPSDVDQTGTPGDPPGPSGVPTVTAEATDRRLPSPARARARDAAGAGDRPRARRPPRGDAPGMALTAAWAPRTSACAPPASTSANWTRTGVGRRARLGLNGDDIGTEQRFGCPWGLCLPLRTRAPRKLRGKSPPPGDARRGARGGRPARSPTSSNTSASPASATATSNEAGASTSRSGHGLVTGIPSAPRSAASRVSACRCRTARRWRGPRRAKGRA